MAGRKLARQAVDNTAINSKLMGSSKAALTSLGLHRLSSTGAAGSACHAGTVRCVDQVLSDTLAFIVLSLPEIEQCLLTSWLLYVMLVLQTST